MFPLRRSCLVLVAALWLLGCGGSSPPRGSLPGGTPIGNAPLGSTPGYGVHNPTLDYWNAINGVFVTIAPYLRQPDRAVRALHEAAYTIQSMPTLGIDPAVVGWALRAATVCEQEANLIENSNAPALLIEALVRGADGDPYGLGVELIAAERQWRAVYAAVRQEGIRLRAALTAHYGIEFPPTAF